MVPDPRPSRERFAAVVDSLGNDTFHAAIVAHLSALFGDLDGLAMRYHNPAPPEMLVDQVLDDQVRELYLNGLYTLDPLNNIPHTGFSAGVYSFLESFDIDSDTIRYQEEVFQRARISDELAWVVMMPDASMLAFCLDKPDGPFSASDLQRARCELPLVRSLALKHFSIEFLETFRERPGASTQVERTLHLASDRIIESARWRPEFALLSEADKSLVEEEALIVRRTGGYREAPLQCDASLSSCSVLLEGERYLRQRIRPHHPASAGDYRAMISRALEAFALTDREGDVIYLALLGYPNALIAGKLAISGGTVRNHKYSIYNKLDITSERELFNLVLKNIVSLTPN